MKSIRNIQRPEFDIGDISNLQRIDNQEASTVITDYLTNRMNNLGFSSTTNIMEYAIKLIENVCLKIFIIKKQYLIKIDFNEFSIAGFLVNSCGCSLKTTDIERIDFIDELLRTDAPIIDGNGIKKAIIEELRKDGYKAFIQDYNLVVGLTLIG